MEDEPLSGFEPEEVPPPPPSSIDDWFDPDVEPQAIWTEATTTGARRREREAEFIDTIVAARREAGSWNL
jgi:hypothetical protein